jgi:LacI family transcriptional regulator
LGDRRRPTMVDVANLAGVSLKTVSRVVNNIPSVDPQLAERVLTAVRQLGFRRNDVAASLRSGSSTSMIGLIIGDITNPFYSGITAAVAAVARGFDAQVITASTEEEPQLERDLALDLCQRRVDGLIIVPSSGDQAYLRAEVDLGIPVVFVDRPPSGIVADTYLLDNRRGAETGVRQMISEGHERIAVVIDSLEIFTMRERLAGVRDALASAGRTLSDEWLSTAAHDPRAAAEIAGTMLDGNQPPTAFFCGNNRATIGVVEELWRRDVPARVVGFDDFDVAAFLPRGVSVIGYDTHRLGTRAAERLFARIDGYEGPAETELLPTELIERGRNR